MFAMKETKPQTNLRQNPRKPTLARKCTGKDCPLEKETSLLQRRANLSAPSINEAPPIVHDVLRSSGQPLDDSTRAFMEPRFNQDFSHVRVHTDAKAAESAHAVNALAYTVGRDIVMRREEYVPTTDAGKRLLAHELAHVVQQGGSQRLQKLQVGAVGDVYEQEANRVAERVVESGDSWKKRQASKAEDFQINSGTSVTSSFSHNLKKIPVRYQSSTASMQANSALQFSNDFLSEEGVVLEEPYIDEETMPAPAANVAATPAASAGLPKPTNLLQLLTAWTPGPTKYGFQLSFRCRSTSGNVRDLQNQAPNLIWREYVRYTRNDFSHRISPSNPTILPAGGVSFASTNTRLVGPNLLEFNAITDTHWMPTSAVRSGDFRPAGSIPANSVGPVRPPLPAVMESRQLYQFSQDGGSTWQYFAGEFIIRRTLFNDGGVLKFRTQKTGVHTTTESYKP